MTLYEMTKNYRELYEASQSNGFDDVQATVLYGLLESLSDDIDGKLLGIARVVKNLQADADAIKAEVDRLSARRQAVESGIKRLKDYAEDAMNAVGIEKVKDELFTVAMQKNPPAVSIVNDRLIPTDYWRQQDPVIDRQRIKDALKAGETIPGAELTQGKSVRFK